VFDSGGAPLVLFEKVYVLRVTLERAGTPAFIGGAP
jgi:hypothetical protein